MRGEKTIKVIIHLHTLAIVLFIILFLLRGNFYLVVSVLVDEID